MIRVNAPMRALACETPKRFERRVLDQANWVGVALTTHGSVTDSVRQGFSNTVQEGVAQVWTDMTVCVKSL